MSKLIQLLKETGQDYEFYPTTNEIVAAVIRDLRHVKTEVTDKLHTVLDIGAGNGKVLKAFREATYTYYGEEERPLLQEFYAIEKSMALCDRLDPEFFIIGTDLMEQSLVSKSVDVTFCNPPYSEFEEWADKIIRESASKFVYLVIPVRWKSSVKIADALKFRDAKAKELGEFSFENAEDRAARAVVHLLRIDLAKESGDAFSRFFDAQFAGLNERYAKAETTEDEGGTRRKTNRFEQIVVGPSYPEAMVSLYNAEIDRIRANYDAVGQLDAEILKELKISPTQILACLKTRLEGLKNIYWKELFTNMRQVTDRITSKRRQAMLDKLHQNGHVDFTVSNIHAIMLWVLKHANEHIEQQTVEVFDKMVDKANVRNYVSNQRVFTYDRWRYTEEKPSHIALEYRIVLDRVGGINRSDYSFEQGLSPCASEFLGDLLTVANTLGFFPDQAERERLLYAERRSWRSGQVREFSCTVNGESRTLLEVRAYLNGNLHMRMDQKFALALNVEVGRLRGWIKNGKQAAEELKDEDAAQYFGSQMRLGVGSLPMLAAPAKVEKIDEKLDRPDQTELLFGT